jgi:hypothetical protein
MPASARASGTSFAAAQLRTVWPYSQPPQLCWRILAPASISPLISPTKVATRGCSTSARRCPSTKDMVDAKLGGQTIRVRGEIDPTQSLFDFCAGTVSLYRSTSANQRRILKIARVEKSASSFLIYFDTDEHVLSSKTCPREAGTTIKIRDSFTGHPYQFTRESCDTDPDHCH